MLKKVELDMDDIWERRQAGDSYREISEIYLCSPSTIWLRYNKWKDGWSNFQKVKYAIKNFIRRIRNLNF